MQVSYSAWEQGAKMIFAARQGISLLMSHASLRGESGSAISSSSVFVDTARAIESLKCLANCLLQNPGSKEPFVSNAGVDSLGIVLKDRASSITLDSQFLMLRLIFLLTVDSSSISQKLVRAYGLIDVLEKPPFRKILSSVIKPVAAGVSPPPGTTITQTMVASEALKIVFNLMHPVVAKGKPVASFLGGSKVGLADGEDVAESVKEYESLLVPIRQLLVDINLPSLALVPPVSHAIHTLMNFPVAPWRELWFPGGDYAIVTRLVDILTAALASAYGGLSPKARDDSPNKKPLVLAGVPLDDALSPLLLVMGSVAKGDQRAREMMKAKLMPDDIDRSKALTEATILTNYVGYGNAAGFLMHRGLLPAGPAAPTTAGSSSTNANINPITGEYTRDDINEEWQKMTDEEKEAEAEKLFVLFDRLNRTGIVKVEMPKPGSGSGEPRIKEVDEETLGDESK
ncbi:hypothetical protein HK104_002245 [Borealophlyctis nickersoniae]|nr:hypothetical protein HK104_002245 [Borealophlyctis nickersoniae]